MKSRLVLLLGRIKVNESVLVFFVFLFFLALNALIYFTIANVSSPDDQWFYTKIAYLLRTEGWSAITNFQGAYFTELSQSGYGYGVGLYHYVLMPFTLFSNKILGLKLSGLFFATLVPTISFWVLRRLKIKNALIWVVAFFYVFGSFNFTMRLFLNRPFVFIDALMLLEIYLISKKKYWALFFVSLIHAWWHPASFWLPGMLAVCFELARILYQKKIAYQNIIFAILGSLGAFLLFPAHSHTFLSPLNPLVFGKKLFSFIYGLGNGPKLIEGSENFKGDIFLMLAQNNIVFACLIFFIALNIFFYLYRHNNVKDLDDNENRAIFRVYVFLVTVVMFLGFVFSRRFEDLLIPLAMLGSAVSFCTLSENGYVLVNNESVRKIFFSTLLLFLLIAGGARILDLRITFGNDMSYLKYEKVGNWFRDNTQKGEIIFNTDFGQFNRLFFFDSDNRYIVGIEPKNMYEYSPRLYWLWQNISLYGVVQDTDNQEKNLAQDILEGKSDKEVEEIMLENSKIIATTIKDNFQSKYLFFDADTFLKKEVAKNTTDYELVYEDKDGGVFVYRIN